MVTYLYFFSIYGNINKLFLWFSLVVVFYVLFCFDHWYPSNWSLSFKMGSTCFLCLVYTFFFQCAPSKEPKLQLEIAAIVKSLYLKVTELKWAKNGIDDIPRKSKMNKLSRLWGLCSILTMEEFTIISTSPLPQDCVSKPVFLPTFYSAECVTLFISMTTDINLTNTG